MQQTLPRLRQVVLAAQDPSVAESLRVRLGLGRPYQDPGVAEFGLVNWVFAVGGDFLEVVSPTRPDAPAARYLRRRETRVAGYMVMFEAASLARTRAVIAAQGWRSVWEIDLPDITDLHLHPADLPGAIVAVDECRPAGSWRWAGPGWQPGSGGGIAEISLSVADPDEAVRRWAGLLEVPATEPNQIELAGQRIRFGAGPDGLHRIMLRRTQNRPPVTISLDRLEIGAT